MDLESADKVASVGGALIALVGLAVTVRGLLRDQGNSAPTGGEQTPPATDDGGGVREIRVHAENGGTAAGNDYTAGMAGRPDRPDGDGPQPRSETRHVHATGPRSTAAGRNITVTGAGQLPTETPTTAAPPEPGPPSAARDGAAPRSEVRDVRATGPGAIAAGNDIHGIDPQRNRP
ncbi:hypothetical protein [Kitasatospora sp. NPDC057015]|uniref:hypothetical protein n=1 Tax=Kitasatospora sp. NPDC057015 TaxID=3346001 RepID=UPI0036251A0A